MRERSITLIFKTARKGLSAIKRPSCRACPRWRHCTTRSGPETRPRRSSPSAGSGAAGERSRRWASRRGWPPAGRRRRCCRRSMRRAWWCSAAASWRSRAPRRGWKAGRPRRPRWGRSRGCPSGTAAGWTSRWRWWGRSGCSKTGKEFKSFLIYLFPNYT